DQLAEELPALARRVRRFTSLPIAVGFGISQPGHVSMLGGLADAAVVGSALVQEVENAGTVDAASSALAARIALLKGAAVAGMSRREPLA
ncbi:MAG: tryptophan synthase subunit alpha, partial [Bryobacteraceae bacterium]